MLSRENCHCFRLIVLRWAEAVSDAARERAQKPQKPHPQFLPRREGRGMLLGMLDINANKLFIDYILNVDYILSLIIILNSQFLKAFRASVGLPLESNAPLL